MGTPASSISTAKVSRNMCGWQRLTSPSGGPDISQLEQAAIASLPIGDRAFGIPVAAPEEVAEIGFRAGRQILERLDHEGRERNIDRRSGFRLVEEKAVALEAVAFEGDGVADAQPAPAH